MLRILILAFVIFINGIIGAKWPSQYPKCHYGDSVCFTNTYNLIIANSGNGIPEINLLPTDPAFVKQMDIIQDNNRPVTLNSYFRNIKIYGLNTPIKQISGFERDLKRAEFHGVIPVLRMLAEYEMKGQLLVLPIEGRGKSNITLTNVDIAAQMIFKREMRKNREVLQIAKVHFTVQPGNVFVQFTNLFNGQQELSDTLHRFINESWREIYAELSAPINDALGGVIKEMINNVLGKFDYRELFLED